MYTGLDHNDILIYPTYNEGESVFAGRFMRTLQYKTYNKVTANNSKSYLGYLNKLIEKDYNTYHRSICKIPIQVHFFNLTEEIEFGNRVTPKIDEGKYLLLIPY